MGTYTKRQKTLLEIMAQFQVLNKSVISLDTLEYALCKGPPQELTWTRNGIANTMRDLIRKLPDDNCTLRSNGLRGRGHRVEYTFNGNIRSLISEPIAA